MILVSEIVMAINRCLAANANFHDAFLAFQQAGAPVLPVTGDTEVTGVVAREALLNAPPGPDYWERSLTGIIDTNFVFAGLEDQVDPAWLNLTAVVVVENGQPAGVISREALATALYRRAAFKNDELNTILNSAHNGIVAINQDGIVTSFNPAAERMTRRYRQDVVGKYLADVIIPTGLLEVVRTGGTQFGERFNVEFSSGLRTYISNRSAIIHNGEIVGAVGIFQDVSEIEFIVEELKSVKELNNELLTIIESSFDGILVTDHQGVVIRVNKAHQRLTGIASDQIIGRRLQDLAEEGYYSNAVVDEVLKRRSSVTMMETSPLQNHLVITGNPVFNQEGEIFRVVINVRDISELNQLRHELVHTKELSERYHAELTALRIQQMENIGIITSSAEMKDLLDLACRVAQVDSTVLILGESGVGKELLAKMIHQTSNRKLGPFIKINCAAIPENLLESELFGYEAGAFTGANKAGKVGMFELAHNGTLFLDEIGDLPLSLQAKLLRVLQEREIIRLGGTAPRKINVRIVTATHRNIEKMINQGEFREDLFFRLNVVPMHIPPLRERRADIIPLIYHFKEKFYKQYKLKKDFSPQVIDILMDYDWPGNVRELENIVERLFVTTPGSEITLANLPAHLTRKLNQSDASISVNGILPLKRAQLELERQLLGLALEKYGTTYRVAEVLDVDQSTIVRKLNRIKKTYPQPAEPGTGGQAKLGLR